MLIIICGDMGSGKTLTTVKEIVDSNKLCYTNFRLKNLKYKRLMLTDIETKFPKTFDKNGDPKTYDVKVNWEYWEKARKENKDFSIFIDEIHNIANSRSAMAKRNIIISRWVSQIRKICSDSGTSHLYAITQNIRTIDVNLRELAHIYIRCFKIELPGKEVIIHKYYYNKWEAFFYNRHSMHTAFYGSPYYKYYDTKELINFDDEEKGYI